MSAGSDTEEDRSATGDEVAGHDVPLAAGVTISAEPVNSYDVLWFKTDRAWGEAPAELLDEGLCGAEQCECFVVAYRDSVDDSYVRPDPENAPNMCYGCTSKSRLDHRKRTLEHGDVTAKRKALIEEHEACQVLLDEALERHRETNLWCNVWFLSQVYGARYSLDAVEVESFQGAGVPTLEEVQSVIFMGTAKYACTRHDSIGAGGTHDHLKMELTKRWIADLDRSAADATPGGGPAVSQETVDADGGSGDTADTADLPDWHDSWNHQDQEEWDTAQAEGWEAGGLNRVGVVLRLLEESDAIFQTCLLRRYGELVEVA